MIVELKEKLKPNSYLFWDGKNIIPVSKDELLGDIQKRIVKIEEFNTSLLERQGKFEGKMKSQFKRFLSIFRRGDKK